MIKIRNTIKAVGGKQLLWFIFLLCFFCLSSTLVVVEVEMSRYLLAKLLPLLHEDEIPYYVRMFHSSAHVIQVIAAVFIFGIAVCGFPLHTNRRRIVVLIFLFCAVLAVSYLATLCGLLPFITTGLVLLE